MYTIDTLVPFDMVLDIDIGLINLIRKEYFDPNVFIPMIFTNDKNYLYYTLQKRENINPLSIFIDPDVTDSDTIDDLYNQFMIEKYNDIIKLSNITNIFNLMTLSLSEQSIKFTLWCKTEQEKEIFKKRFEKISNKIIVEEDIRNIDISKYGNIYIKNYKDILKFNNLEKKNIYISNNRFNFEIINNKEIPLLEITQHIYPFNKIYTVDLHTINYNNLPVG